MNTAMRLLNNFVKMNEATDGLDSGSAGHDLDWLLEDDNSETVDIVEEEDKAPEVETPEGDGDSDNTQNEVEEDKQNTEVEEQQEQKPEQQQQQQQQEQTTPPEQLTPEQLEERKELFRAELEKQFAISEDDANLLVTAPEQVLPRLASQVVMRTLAEVNTMQQQILQAIPAIIQQVNLQTTAEQDAKTQFMTMHPDLAQLDSKTLDSAVMSLAPIVKQQFPNATPQERMEKLGKMIAVTYGVQPKVQQQQQPRSAKPYTPAAPARSSVPPTQQPLSRLQREIEDLLAIDD